MINSMLIFYVNNVTSFLENVEYLNQIKMPFNIFFLSNLIQNLSKSFKVLLKNPFIIFLSSENIILATFFETYSLLFNSTSFNFFLVKLNRFSIAMNINVITMVIEPENSGVLLGVRSILILSSYAILIIKEDL